MAEAMETDNVTNVIEAADDPSPWPLPPDEAERIRTLKNLELLDSPKDEEFERITALCGSALDVPICLVSLVDERRQWFLSNRGLGATKETGREIAFCAHSIMPSEDNKPKEIMVVRDALADPRFAESALVLGWPHIRFYAGAPLLVGGSDGVKRAIGTLCVIDTAVEHGGTGARTEQAFGVREKQILLDFGALLTGAIEAREQAKRALSAAKTDYISCTAHDIRTPVACFQLSLELLAQSPLNDEQREYVKHAQQSVEIMTETVDRAIEAARAQRGATPMSIRKEAVNVRQLLDRIDSLTRSLSAQRPRLRFHVAADVPEIIETDGTLVWRILMNYVTNALKAAVRPGAAAGLPVVDVRVTKVSTHDTGVSPAPGCTALLCRAGVVAAQKRGLPPTQADVDAARLQAEADAHDIVGLAPPEAPASGEWLKLEVEDSGPGVDAHLRKKLFNAFVQAPGTREGTGLGLFAVKQCAEMLRGACGARFKSGRTEAETDLDASPPAPKRARAEGMLAPKLASPPPSPAPSQAGAVFWVLVPFRLPSADSSDKSGGSSPSDGYRASPRSELRALPDAPPTIDEGSSATRRALVVEDSSPIRKMLKRLLEKNAFAVDEAGNGEIGLEKLRANTYDVCVMDFLMPIMDGVTCTRTFREWEKRHRPEAHTVIIGSSANADEVEIKSALDGNFDDFIGKPVTSSTLKDALRTAGLLEPAAPAAGS